MLVGGVGGWERAGSALFDLEALAGRRGAVACPRYRLAASAPALAGSAKSTARLPYDYYAYDDFLEEGTTLAEVLGAVRAEDEPTYAMLDASFPAAQAAHAALLAETRQPPLGAPPAAKALFWLGTPGTGVGLHSDRNCAQWLCQTAGCKAVLLVDPREAHLLHPVHHLFGRLDHMSKAADLECADVRRFPRLTQCTVYLAFLAPGDVLYIPPWWWHDPKALEPSVSVTFRSYPVVDRPPGAVPPPEVVLREAVLTLYDVLASMPEREREAYANRVRHDMEYGLFTQVAAARGETPLASALMLPVRVVTFEVRRAVTCRPPLSCLLSSLRDAAISAARVVLGVDLSEKLRFEAVLRDPMHGFAERFF